MSQLFGWVPAPSRTDGRHATDGDSVHVIDRMAAALRVDPAQRVAVWERPGLAIGALEPPLLPGELDDLEPAGTIDGRFWLWMSGEAFGSTDADLDFRSAGDSRTIRFRRALLERWLRSGVDTIRRLDGEYHVAVWDARDRVLSLVNDRFGGLPMYWSESSHGVAFAGGVRGVLMAPAVSPRPDHDALREAVTFGGYRLGTRTNITAVHMVEGATLQILRDGRRNARRYWHWNDIPSQAARDMRDLIPELHSRWKRAVARRMSDDARYGQTLSGGLDSRAVLAEAAEATLRRSWTAITYGVPGCDDERYARRAAAAAGASWVFLPLYAGDWLTARSAHVQTTDGLIELGDLMHLESLPLQRELFDVHLSGYIGDAVSGPTFASVESAAQVVVNLPYYGTSISLDYPAAVARVRQLVDGLNGAPRYAVFEHKLPQSTNRWTAAWRPWLRVRKPFVDYQLFDFCQGLPPEVRTSGQLHERWLRAKYPACFGSIPNQKTGVRVLAPAWRVRAARVGRGVTRELVGLIPSRWRPRARARSYHDNDRVWRHPDVVGRIVGPIVRKDALSAEIFGVEPIRELVEAWRQSARAPAQVIGALYVFETYHAGLAGFLRQARAEAAAAPRLKHPGTHSSRAGDPGLSAVPR